MIRRIRLLPLILLLALVPATGASAAPDHTEEFAPGDSFEWSASTLVGVNPNYYPWVPQAEAVFPVGQCSKNPNYYCDTLLLKFSNPMTQEEIDDLIARGRPLRKSRTASVTVGNYAFPAADFDLRSFESDAEGTKGAEITDSGNLPGEAEAMAFSIVTTPEISERWVLVEVGYWAGIGGYDGTVSF